MRFKNFKGKPERKSLKRTISASGGLGRRTNHLRVLKSLPSIHVLKTLRENPKGKVQREQYLLVVGWRGERNI